MAQYLSLLTIGIINGELFLYDVRSGCILFFFLPPAPDGRRARQTLSLSGFCSETLIVRYD